MVGLSMPASRPARRPSRVGGRARAAAFEPLEPRVHLSATRDPWIWPFAANSIWNTSIGSGAAYTAANLGGLGQVVADYNYLVASNANDPLYQVIRPDHQYGTDGKGATGVYLNVPQNLTITKGPNNASVWLKPDGVTIYQFSPFSVSPGTNPEGYVYQTYNITTDIGNLGSHAGSGLSGIGGTLRNGDLTSSTPITHALQIELDWAQLWRDNSNKANMDQTYRWPATRSDGNFGGTADANNTGVPNYTGTVPGLSMGALLALPANLTATGLGLQTPGGLKMFHALQDYGAYVVDTSGINYKSNNKYVTNFTITPEEDAAFMATNDYHFGTFNNGTVNNAAGASAWFSDMNAIYSNLMLVSNNSSTNVGGGGTPRQAAPPPVGVRLPAAPSNLTESATLPTAITLSWTNNASNQNGFVIERATDRSFGQNLTTVATVGAGVTQYVDSVAAGPTYYYRVHAFNDSGNSTDTNTVTVTTSTTQIGSANEGIVNTTNNGGPDRALQVGDPTGTAGYKQSVIFAFQLPTLGAVTNPFQSASFTVTSPSQYYPFAFNSGNTYGLTGLGVSASNAIAASYYAASGTTLKSNFVSASNFGGNTNPNQSVDLSQDITTYLNTQYAGGANAGKFVFLRIQSNWANSTWTYVNFSRNEALRYTLRSTQQVNLSSYYNKVGITANGATFSSTGGFDGHGKAYSSTLLGSSVTWNGSTFALGAAGSNNIVSGNGTSGTTITVAAGNYSTLKLLASHANGNATNLPIIVNYSDGTSTTFYQSFSDWYTPQGYAGESVAVSTAYRNVFDGTRDNRTFNVYGYSFALDNTKIVTSIVLPSDSNLGVLAVDLQP